MSSLITFERPEKHVTVFSLYVLPAYFPDFFAVKSIFAYRVSKEEVYFFENLGLSRLNRHCFPDFYL